MKHMATLARLAMACTALCCLRAESQAIAQKPLRDPFVRPAGIVSRPAPAADAGRTGSPDGSGGLSGPAPASELKPELRAVVLDHQHSLVNLGGRILGIGESADGYRLLNVEERSAVFAKDGARIRLMLDKEKSK